MMMGPAALTTLLLQFCVIKDAHDGKIVDKTGVHPLETKKKKNLKLLVLHQDVLIPSL